VPSVLAKSAGARAAAGCGSRPLTWTHRCRPFGAEASGGLEPSAHAITRQGAQRQRDRTGAVHAACSRSLKRVDPLPRQRGGRRRCLRRADQLARAAGQAGSGHPGGGSRRRVPDLAHWRTELGARGRTGPRRRRRCGPHSGRAPVADPTHYSRDVADKRAGRRSAGAPRAVLYVDREQPAAE
jgi:hypothetical protein